jgi:hypothetical protein
MKYTNIYVEFHEEYVRKVKFNMTSSLTFEVRCDSHHLHGVYVKILLFVCTVFLCNFVKKLQLKVFTTYENI